jgi:hypothetical protein
VYYYLYVCRAVKAFYNHLIKYEKDLKTLENSRSFKSALVGRGELDSMTSDPVLLKRAIDSLQKKFDLGHNPLINSHFIRVLLRRKDVNAFFLLLALSIYMRDDCVVSRVCPQFKAIN